MLCVIALSSEQAEIALESSLRDINKLNDSVVASPRPALSCHDSSAAMTMELASESTSDADTSIFVFIFDNQRFGYVAFFLEKLQLVQTNNVTIIHPGSISKNYSWSMLVLDFKTTIDHHCHEHSLPPFDWKRVRFEQGSSRDSKFLKKISLTRSAVQSSIVFADERRFDISNGATYPAFVDRTSILTAYAMDEAIDSEQTEDRRKLFESRFTLFEFLDQNSAGHLRQYADEQSCDYNEKIMCSVSKQSEVLFQWPLFAAGRIFCHSMLDTLAFSMASCSLEFELWTSLFDLDSTGFGCEAIPFDFVGETFASLFSKECESGRIVIGLYRPSGTFGSFMPYAHTNPSPSTCLVFNDRMFVLKSTAECRNSECTPKERTAASFVRRLSGEV
jgi:hypothetical protein